MKIGLINEDFTEEAEAVKQQILTTRLSQGNQVEKFEKEFAGFVGSNHAVALSSGTSALHLALLALGIGKGDGVIVPPMTFFATIEAVMYVGATPIFADIDRTGCISSSTIVDEIKHNEHVKAIIPVHLYGNACDMPAIRYVATCFGVSVIEDAAQAHNTLCNGRHVGTFGDMGIFSFYATKDITTCGEGGMLVTDNGPLAQRVRNMRSHGIVAKTHHALGYNYRMTEAQAVFGQVQLGKLNDRTQTKEANWKYLKAKLAEIEYVSFLEEYSYVTRNTRFWYPVIIDGGMINRVIDALEKAGIEYRRRYVRPLYYEPAVLAYVHSTQIPYLPVAEDISRRIIGLPNSPSLTRQQMDYIVEAIKRI